MARTFYVVREWVRQKQGSEKELRTHLQYGTFATYEGANNCAKMIEGGMCFPQQVEGESK
jgi:hypothetical protein